MNVRAVAALTFGLVSAVVGSGVLFWSGEAGPAELVSIVAVVALLHAWAGFGIGSLFSEGSPAARRSVYAGTLGALAPLLAFALLMLLTGGVYLLAFVVGMGDVVNWFETPAAQGPFRMSLFGHVMDAWWVIVPACALAGVVLRRIAPRPAT